jgi:hypothetical protein
MPAAPVVDLLTTTASLDGQIILGKSYFRQSERLVIS